MRASLLLLTFIFMLSLSSTLGQRLGDPELNTSVYACQENRRVQVLNLQRAVNEALAAERDASEAMPVAEGGEAKIAALEAEMAAVLAELKAGEFCSICGKSSTQLGGPVKFQAHLVDVKGKPVPASPERIAQAENEYRAKIKHINDAIFKLHDAKFKRQVAGQETENCRISWYASAVAEDFLRCRDFQKYSNDQMVKIRSVRSQIASLKATLAKLLEEAEAKKVIQSTLSKIQGTEADLISDLVSRQTRERGNVLSARSAMERDRLMLQARVAQLSDKFFLSGTGYMVKWGPVAFVGASPQLPVPL